MSATINKRSLAPAEILCGSPTRSVAPAGVVIGQIASHSAEGVAVEFASNPTSQPVLCRSIVPADRLQVNREVVLAFEEGDLARPIILGVIEPPPRASAELDGERMVLSAEREIVLRCGDASLTLTRAGKVLIRGKYVLSRSSGPNRIKGAVVEIN